MQLIIHLMLAIKLANRTLKLHHHEMLSGTAVYSSGTLANKTGDMSQVR